MPTRFDDAATAALADLAVLTRAHHVEWALVGGLALQSYGVPRETLDAGEDGGARSTAARRRQAVVARLTAMLAATGSPSCRRI